MTNEDRKAEALARWLDDDPGQEPPAELDADVVEAVYSLSPDRVPSARVSANEILHMVTSGPFASGSPDAAQAPQQAPAEVVPFPVPQQSAPSAPSAQANQSGNVWWLTGGAVTLLAAAVALVVVLPGLFNAEPAMDSASFQPVMSSPEIADAPSSSSPTSADSARPALAVIDAERAPTENGVGSEREFSQGIELGIITESGDGVAGDAVADLGDAGDQELDDLFDAAPADVDFDGTRSAQVKQAPITITRGAMGARGEDRTVSSSLNKVAVSPGATKDVALSDRARPDPWPSSQTEAGQLLTSAKRHLDAGRLERAQQAAQMGLDLEYQNTPVRSALLWVRGQAQAGQGRAAAAKSSYIEADELNTSR